MGLVLSAHGVRESSTLLHWLTPRTCAKLQIKYLQWTALLQHMPTCVYYIEPHTFLYVCA